MRNFDSDVDTNSEDAEDTEDNIYEEKNNFDPLNENPALKDFENMEDDWNAEIGLTNQEEEPQEDLIENWEDFQPLPTEEIEKIESAVISNPEIIQEATQEEVFRNQSGLDNDEEY